MKTYKSRGIVLHTIKYGESSVVVQMLTDTYGRQSYMVQGIRSARGKGSKMALFQPMFALEFEGLTSSKMDMHRIREVRNGIVLQSLPYDIRKSTIALFMAEVIYRLIGESEANAHLFNFAWASIEALDAIEQGVANFHLWFLSNISRYLGFAPGNDYIEGAWFDMREGLYTPIVPLHDNMMTPEQARLLHDMIDCDIRDLDEIGLNRTQRVEMLSALVDYYAIHLDSIRRVESLHILREVF